MALRTRRQHVQLGGFPAIKLNAPLPFADLYYAVMEMGWGRFIGIICLIFVALNLLFGAIYAALPGSVSNAQPGSLVDGFFFSVDTLATVGYGVMAPQSRTGHAVAALEILIGLFFTATITGLIFARFARPRQSLAFSRVAVIGRYLGEPALIIRAVSLRSRPLASASAQIAWLQRIEHPDGRSSRQLADLPLVRAQNPMLTLAWTLVHMIEPDSAMLAALRGTDRFMLSVTIGGTDMLLANQTQDSASYSREQVLIDHEFVDMISDGNGVLHIDLGRLHDAVPLAAA